MSRPNEYSEDIADLICQRIADGKSLRAICLDDDMPSRATVFRWLAANKGFETKYAHAREEQADIHAEGIVDISDEIEVEATYKGEAVVLELSAAAVARNRLRVDARKWYASKLAPKKYGDRLLTEHSGGIKVQAVTDLTDDDLAAIATSGGG